MNQAFLSSHIPVYFFSLPNDKIMFKCTRLTGYKIPCFDLPLPMYDQQVFSSHNINILLSTEQVLNENKDKCQPHAMDIV